MNEFKKLDTMSVSKNGEETKKIETIEVKEKEKEKDKSYIKSMLYRALEGGQFTGISVISFFLWLIKKCGEKVKKDAMRGIKESFKALESINKSH